MNNDNTKPWYLSKTLWVNIVAFMALIIQGATGDFVISPEEQAAVIVFINLILRAVTGKELTLRKN